MPSNKDDEFFWESNDFDIWCCCCCCWWSAKDDDDDDDDDDGDEADEDEDVFKFVLLSKSEWWLKWFKWFMFIFWFKSCCCSWWDDVVPVDVPNMGGWMDDEDVGAVIGGDEAGVYWSSCSIKSCWCLCKRWKCTFKLPFIRTKVETWKKSTVKTQLLEHGPLPESWFRRTF